MSDPGKRRTVASRQLFACGLASVSVFYGSHLDLFYPVIVLIDLHLVRVARAAVSIASTCPDVRTTDATRISAHNCRVTNNSTCERQLVPFQQVPEI